MGKPLCRRLCYLNRTRDKADIDSNDPSVGSDHPATPAGWRKKNRLARRLIAVVGGNSTSSQHLIVELPPLSGDRGRETLKPSFGLLALWHDHCHRSFVLPGRQNFIGSVVLPIVFFHAPY